MPIKLIRLACALASLSAFGCAMSADQALGQLFTSPSQRVALNSLREQYQRGLYTGEGSAVSQEAYQFNGVLSQQGKAKVIWINGVNKVATSQAPNLRGEYRVNFPQGQVQLKPGQNYQPVSEAVTGVLLESHDEH